MLKRMLLEHYVQLALKVAQIVRIHKLLGISPETLQNPRVNDTLTIPKIGMGLFYEYMDIIKILNANRVKTLG